MLTNYPDSQSNGYDGFTLADVQRLKHPRHREDSDAEVRKVLRDELLNQSRLNQSPDPDRSLASDNHIKDRRFTYMARKAITADEIRQTVKDENVLFLRLMFTRH